MRLELPIFFNTDESDNLKLISDELDFEKCEIRKVVFYQINAISKYVRDGQQDYTAIHANGADWICPKTLQEVDELISKTILIYSI
jgi:hypothetical protein